MEPGTRETTILTGQSGRCRSRCRPLPASLFPLSLILLFAFGCRDAFTTDVVVVARAGDSELTVDRLAEVFAQGKALAMQRNVIERVARLWVDYSLFAQKIVSGDSLLDSATVVQTLWPEVQQRMADHFHDGLVARRVKFDSTRADSTYAAGEYRLLEHILVRTEPTLAPPVKDAKRKKAAEIRARLVKGESWADANKSSEDPEAKANGGSLGVLTRGEMPASFENAAFALQPGQISEVVESPMGFHIIRRPTLKEKRAAYIAGVEDRMVQRMDSDYLAGLADRRHVETTGDTPARVRAALADPLDAASSRSVLGTFDGGKFTVGDLLRWINAMPTQVEEQVSRADDAQIDKFVRSLMRNHALMAEADSAGVRLSPLDIEEFRGMLRADLDKVRKSLNLDDPQLKNQATPMADRQRQAALYVDTYLESVANNKAPFVSVPPFLAARLRDETSWKVSSAGVERVLEKSTALRAAVDSLRPATTPDSGGTNGTR